MQNFLKVIEKDLQSNNPTDCAYAIRACCIQRISDDKIIEILKVLKNSNKYAMMNKISDSAVAVLDILGTEKYTGDNPKIQDIMLMCHKVTHKNLIGSTLAVPFEVGSHT